MISKRINFLNSLVRNNIVYDMCCDHGLIGELALKESKEVIFIDVVPDITKKLGSRLSNSYSNYTVVTKSILEIDEFKDNSSIILAGIGSKLLAEFLTKYSAQFNNTHQLIISSHSNQHIAIEAMNNAKLTRVEDYMIEDSARHYEIYSCYKKPDFRPNLSLNSCFKDFKGSKYHLDQLKFLEFKKESETAQELFRQLQEI